MSRRWTSPSPTQGSTERSQWLDAGNHSVVSAPPDPILAPYVRRYVQRSFDLGAAELVEPVVARLGAMLEFQFFDPYAIPAYADGKPNPCPPVTIIGPISYRRVRLLIRGRVEALAVLFQPLGFYQLFGIPTGPLAEIGTDAQAVLGPNVSRLHARLGELVTFADRVSAVDRFLLAFVRPVDRDPVSAGLKQMLMPGATGSITDVARDAGVNLRHLQRKALDYAGLPPRLLSRIARFQHALTISERTHRSLTEIAHAANYYDQPHMVRDFHRMAGAAPNEAIGAIAPGHLVWF